MSLRFFVILYVVMAISHIFFLNLFSLTGTGSELIRSREEAEEQVEQLFWSELSDGDVEPRRQRGVSKDSLRRKKQIIYSC